MRSTTRRLGRRGRRTLLLALALLGLVNAAAAAALQASGRLRDPMYHQRADLLAARSAAADRPFVLVALGSSRTQGGFDPLGAALEDRLAGAVGRPAVAFNFGVQGAGPLLHELYLRRLLAEGPRPDALFLEVTPTMLLGVSGAPRERVSRALDVRFVRWAELDVLERRGAGWPGMRDEWLKARAKGLWEYRFQFVWAAVPAWVPAGYSAARGAPGDACGWTPPWIDGFTDARRPAAQARARDDHGPVLAAGELHPAPVASLRAICELCRDEHIPLSLVLMPEGPSFRSLYAPEVEARVAAVIDGLAAEFGVPVVNAREWVEEPEFADGHHLLPAGARRFTARLADEAILPRAARWRRE